MSTDMSSTLKFISLIGKLKSTKRTGWVYRNVKEPESVADHMYRMAVMAFLITDTNSPVALKKDRCIKLALVHDMAECLVGDITPMDNVSKEEKHRKEKEAMEHIQSLVDEDIGREIYNLWEEYEFQTSEESRFVKDLDRFDMILQAFEYETAENKPKKLQEFFDSTEGKFQHPLVKGWADELDQVRNSVNKENAESEKKHVASS